MSNPPSNPSPVSKPLSERRLWEFRWVRDLTVLVAIALFITLAYQIRAILLPVLIGLALAYVINPVVRGAERKWRWPRWFTTGLIQGVIIGFFGGLLLFVLPRLIGEVRLLLRNLPAYLESFAAQFNLSLGAIQDQLREIVASVLHGASAATQPATQAATQAAEVATTTTAPAVPPGALAQVDLQTVGTIVAKILNLGVQVVLTGISLGAYLVLAAVITILCMFFFSWRLDGISHWFRSFIPTDHKSQTLHILGRMDVAVSAFVRGRIMQGTILAIVLSIGWSIAGVPYALLLALICGLLNLVPYASMIGLPIAVTLTWVDHLTTGGQVTIWGVLIYPAIAYLLAQQFDNWIVEPLVQGKATGLDPLAILLSVLIGSALAGLFGMLLAVPIAACVKILSEEVLVPKFRAFLGSRDDSVGPKPVGENSQAQEAGLPQNSPESSATKA